MKEVKLKFDGDWFDDAVDYFGADPYYELDNYLNRDGLDDGLQPELYNILL